MNIPQLRPACRQSDSDQLISIDTIEAALNTLDTYRLELLTDLDARGLAKELGAKDTIELLSLRHRRDPADLRRDLKLVKALPKYDAVTAALPDPYAAPTDDSPADSTPADDSTDEAPTTLTADLARVIVATLDKAPADLPPEVLQVAEEQLIEAARYLTPAGLRDFARQVLDRLDTDGPEPAEEEAYHNEKLWIRPADHGVKFGGYLAGANAELLKTAIHGLAKPHKTVDGDLDPRSYEKRQADALTTILDIATGVPAATGVPGVPHLTVTIDFNDLRDNTSEAVGELTFGANLSAAAVRLLACDAAILPIVLGTDSQPLDVGTEYRFVTRPIRRALIRRDKGCVICKAPPSHCHAHHLIHWADGGPTSITNLVLLCGAHHRAVHAGHWSVTITNGTIQITRPHWTIPTPTRLTLPAPSTNTPAHPNTASTTPPPSTTPTSPRSDTPTTSPSRGTPPTPPCGTTSPTPPSGTTPTSPGSDAPLTSPPSGATPPSSPWGTVPAPPPRTTSPATGTLTLDGTAADWRTPTAGWSVNLDPHNPQTNRLRPTAATAATAAARGLSWLTPEAVADLNPWGETGTPSTGP
jgi:uncharacterized protein DUF222/HNH endonuclease